VPGAEVEAVEALVAAADRAGELPGPLKKSK
jgi:hypothetical protein